MPNSRLYFGYASGPTPPGEDTLIFQRVELTPTMISSKQFNLSYVPSSTNNLTAWIINGGTFIPGIDFTITGTLVDFSISSYAPVLTAGQQIQFIYKRI